MRRASILAIVLGCAAGPALAGSPGAGPLPSAQALAAAAFAADHDPIGRLLDRNVAAAPGPGLLPPAAEHGDLTAPGYVVRQWPGAVSFGAGAFDIDVSPHASLAFDRFGESQAEAGATVQLSRADAAAERLKALGVKDGAEFGDRGRWYLFAAASGRAVGLNMLHGEGGWNRAGWSTDPTSKLVGDTQVGVGWRKGPMQTSLGYVRREVKGDHLMQGVDPQADSMVAFSFSIKPRR